jgi:hypothetical protein
VTPSLGLIIALPALLLAANAAAVTGLWLRRRARRVEDDFDATGLRILGTLACITALLIVIGTAFGMWPYKAEYHTWRTTSGTVQAIDSRLVSNGDQGMSQRFVVTFTDGRQRACDDTRCPSVKVGDRLTLKCKRAYQWGATPGWDCNWVGVGRQR